MSGMLTPAVLNVDSSVLTHGFKLCCRNVVDSCVVGAYVTPATLRRNVGGTVCGR